MQWAGADSRITSDKVCSPVPLSGHATVDTMGCAGGDEEARVSLKNIYDL